MSLHNLTRNIIGVNIEAGTADMGHEAWEFSTDVPKEGTAELNPGR